MEKFKRNRNERDNGKALDTCFETCINMHLHNLKEIQRREKISKQETANNIQRLVSELNKAVSDAELVGLTVDFFDNKHSLDKTDKRIEAGIYEQIKY